MSDLQVWQLGLGVFLGTLPLTGLILWNLLELKSFRSEVRTELNGIHTELTNIRERVATLEERDRWTHPQVVER